MKLGFGRFLFMLAVGGTLMASPISASPGDEDAAVAASKTWLALVDKQAYRDSWKQAAAFFKGAVKESQWVSQVTAVRAPLGQLIDRKLKSTHFATTLPGAPDGEYVVIQYDTSFEKKKSAIETITPMKEANGQWRVTGYYIR